LARRHCGQRLRGGSFSVQAEARRLRLFDFEVFFLGTAIVVSLIGPRVGRLARAGLVVAVHTALRAQTPAVVLTEWCERQLQDTGIVDDRFQVEKIAPDDVLEVGVGVVRADLVHDGDEVAAGGAEAGRCPRKGPGRGPSP